MQASEQPDSGNTRLSFENRGGIMLTLTVKPKGNN